MITRKPWVYFGCRDGSTGHGLYGIGFTRMPTAYRDLTRFDGLLPDQNDPTPYQATFTRLPSWELSALAWWDLSVDSRRGSNSVIFAPSLVIQPQDMLTEAISMFPEVFRRLPEPVLIRLPLHEMAAKLSQSKQTDELRREIHHLKTTLKLALTNEDPEGLVEIVRGLI